MVRRRLRAAALAFWFSILGSLPLHGQRARAAPDSALARRYHDALAAVRDTLDGVTAAAWDLNRDLRSAGAETVLARARRLRERCQAATLFLPEAVRTFQYSLTPGWDRGEVGALRGALRRLEVVLREQCEPGFRADGPGSWADSLRAWSPYRSNQIDQAIRSYGAAAARFAAAAGVRLEPKLPSTGPSKRR